ncbi:hypothetical protein GobsT_14170 [Gemmata obscuriglobus]|uniref:Type II toxin-antitoxin system ParD family antitoxin n=1 Tax=Gemmata obscuriglobus TaxID=114 RepID=A0A2Z3H5J2_9BACT|nr:type II toxin-antitoxin system ParD family antitoxin [Gemmata obscuriglobus]AWM40151.1 type II toxin-antitoxin system ParD family antitoxin [Gemmata obscuriglobus]QEG26672.1 hypothetical protein GobsT_14170 [Gemmata obscuriglobus]VTS02305.1 Antitoxin ParD1 OS=Thiomonas sp. CB2 GN=parD PE=4 SV=1: RHH_2 [Gemmata obscuriglobus UQM 2246]
MKFESALPPHLEQFVRDQLATGRFRSEGEVVHTALHLLEGQAHSREADSAWLKQELDKGLSSRPGEPITRQFWDQLRARVRTRAGRGDGA